MTSFRSRATVGPRRRCRQLLLQHDVDTPCVIRATFVVVPTMCVLIDRQARFSVDCCQLRHGIFHGSDGRRAQVRAIGSRPLPGAIGRHRDLESPFMKQPVVKRTQEDKIFDRGLSSVNPVLDVVGVEPPSVVASWELAAPVTGYQRTTNRGRYGASLTSDGQWLAVVIDGDGDQTAVARQPAEHLRGDAGAVFEGGVELAFGELAGREVEQELCPVASGTLWPLPREESVGHSDQTVARFGLGSSQLSSCSARASSRAASMAFMTRAASSVDSWAQSLAVPSPLVVSEIKRASSPRELASSSAVAARTPRQMRSSWAAVEFSARVSSVCSFSGVATRVIARTFE